MYQANKKFQKVESERGLKIFQWIAPCIQYVPFDIHPESKK